MGPGGEVVAGLGSDAALATTWVHGVDVKPLWVMWTPGNDVDFLGSLMLMLGPSAPLGMGMGKQIRPRPSTPKKFSFTCLETKVNLEDL